MKKFELFEKRDDVINFFKKYMQPINTNFGGRALV